MLIGYARVSTIEQNLDLQLDALKLAGCEKIYTDKMSGANNDRPNLTRCLEDLRAGDCLVVWKLDRLGRSLRHLISIIEDLGERGVSFKSIQEPFLDTTSPSGEMMFAIFAALAQYERRLIQERVKAGLAAARARGRKGGRPPVPKEKLKAALALWERQEFSPEQCAALMKVSKPTFYRYLAKARALEIKKTGEG